MKFDVFLNMIQYQNTNLKKWKHKLYFKNKINYALKKVWILHWYVFVKRLDSYRFKLGRTSMNSKIWWILFYL